MTTKEQPEEALPFGSADSIRDLDDYRSQVVEVPEWGCRLIVGTMTGKQRGQYDARMAKATRGKRNTIPTDFREWLVALSVHDEQRGRVFTDADVAMLGQRNAGALQRLFAVANKLNGLGLEDVEDAEKN